MASQLLAGTTSARQDKHFLCTFSLNVCIFSSNRTFMEQYVTFVIILDIGEIYPMSSGHVYKHVLQSWKRNIYVDNKATTSPLLI